MFSSKFHINFVFQIAGIYVVLLLIFLFFNHFIPNSLFLRHFLHTLFFMTLFLVMYFHVKKPIDHLLKTLQTDDPSHVQRLLRTNDELGQLATCILQTLQHKKKLTNEIVDRKNAENALRESEERYRKLVETSPDAIIMINHSGMIVLSNQRAIDLLSDPSSKDVQNENFYNFVPEEEHEHITEALRIILKKEQIRSFECVMKKNASSLVFNAELSMSLIANASGESNAFICIVRDISDRKRIELEKSQLEEQFRSVYKMEVIGQLAGGIAHDFNNILGAISGYADIILMKYGNDEKLSKYSQMILSASTRASELTKKLLTFSRKSKLSLDSFDAHAVLFEVAEILSHTIDKSIKVSTNFLAEQSIIIGDVTQFQSAIMNLALNARDAMPDGGDLFISTSLVLLNQKLTIFHTYTIIPGTYLSISVKDNGMGMDQNTLSHMFEPFFTTKDIGKGTGLGLASAYGTVKSHSGYIDVKSQLGKGSEFTMYLPISSQNKQTISTEIRTFRKGKGTILVVDDEIIMRDAVREMLTWLGYTVNTCSDSRDAVKFYKYNYASIDLVILDMIMPGMNGKECFRQIKLINKYVKVLLATGHRIDEERSTLLEEGFVGIIQKPFASSILAQAVHDALT